MPVDATHSPLQPEELYTLFRNRLHECAETVYASLLERGIVRRAEIDEEIDRYFTGKRAGLQQVYSYYAEQWDAYYRLREASDTGFLSLLGRLGGAFSRRYGGYELNADFYIQAFRKMAVGTPRWNQLRQFFEERWYNLLSDREHNYQMEHIERLCADYYRMARAEVNVLDNQGKAGDDIAPRLEWLQARQSPELKKRLHELSAVLRRNPIIKELNALLGRRVPLSEKRYKALLDKSSVLHVRASAPSDIVGVEEGDNLNALLPLEYATVADSVLQPLFLKRYTEKSLQVFKPESKIREKGNASSQQRSDVSAPAKQGPFVVCVDSSGSMAGTFEDIAKAIVLCIGLLSEQTGRRCRVVLFSDQVESVEFGSLYEGLPVLSDFFCRSFHGGTDVQVALSEAVTALHREEYAYADLLVLSDFEMETPDLCCQQQLMDLKDRNVGTYAVAFGGKANDFYLDMADKYWIYR